MNISALRGLRQVTTGLETSAVLRIMERIGDAERAEWANFLRGGKRYGAFRRAYELSVLQRVRSGAVTAAEMASRLDGWTDWLQMRAAGVATGTDLLDIIATAGRTRRIRHTARDRRDWIACRRPHARPGTVCPQTVTE